MVYCGKPSKGCGQCRTRKIRCDQARPACSQCVRAKRDCPGYRDQLSLMFRDESKSVVRKAEAGSSSSSTSSAPSASRQKRSPARTPRTASPDGSTASELTVSVDPGLDSLHDLFDFNSDPQFDMYMPDLWQMPLEVQPTDEASQMEAVCYFLRSNAIPGTFWMSDFVTKFLMHPGGTVSQQAMQASIIAVSSAMLSRVRRTNSLKVVARKEYVSALSLLNTALADAEEAKTNQALGAVVLLAIYEVVTSRAPQDIDLWTNHINGATALLDLRGTDQLKTEAGLRLFLHLRYQIIISCIQRDTRVPESLLECSKFAMFLRPSEAHSNRLVMVIGRLSNLRAEILAKTFNHASEIIAAASAIEADLIAWLAALPPDFNYENLTKPPFDFLFQERCRGIALYDNQYHVYPTLWVCSTWNQYRCARIIVSEIILSHIRQISDSSSLRSLSDEFKTQCNTLRSTIRRLAVDICRSVPFHLGAHLKYASPNFPPPESYIGGLMLLWPLFLAGVVENPSHSLRRWVVSCLRMIGNTMGLDQALALMDIVASDPGILHQVLEEDEIVVTGESSSSLISSVPKKTPVSLINLPYSTIPASEGEP
ncbi:Histidine phosphatase superfamily clade-1 [Penicillium atrosanguineum]|uniref:Zn(2)-C6 fungal-type domain-containing protein n=1 Tax=Penicillium atrosanguineum TaxID=1132637 RepID=A0A9W9QDR7_9EURO|nr:Histidine phosphatase superfamily clade-1 [Penicillium atrosanguineum]KAJ5314611.1 Histidine phosphatase superfamily clade-1 [Penicillium atrosanguineum]KAJ5331782.1 hypothetical protein N7476_001565 [Penicillium atrosanguineum]